MAFGWEREELYRKRNGEFFLLSADDEIVPLDYEDARDWAENRLDGNEVDDIFGALSDDDTDEVVGITLSLDAAKALRTLAQDQGKSVSAIVQALILGA